MHRSLDAILQQNLNWPDESDVLVSQLITNSAAYVSIKASGFGMGLFDLVQFFYSSWIP
jgi:hypothetical protein